MLRQVFFVGLYRFSLLELLKKIKNCVYLEGIPFQLQSMSIAHRYLKIFNEFKNYFIITFKGFGMPYKLTVVIPKKWTS
jgi:hypothetical protein